MTGHVFLSFDRVEALPYVDGLAQYLTASGVPVWYDRETGGEQRWNQVVGQIASCSAFVVVMTPAAEASAWVTAELAYARQLGKPIVPLLLQGTPLAGLEPAESVVGGRLPGPGLVDRLRAAVPYPPLPVVAPAPRRTGLIVGLVAGSLVLVLTLLLVAGAVAYQLFRVDSGPNTWQEQAADIDGLQNYLVSHPDWYQYDPRVGNHQRGRISYPIAPPAGGVHNPVWQNCMGDVYPAEIAQEHAMHSLEHGAVWLTYRPGLSSAQVARLAQRVRNVPYTFMSPYPGLDHAVSVQAWGYQLRLDDVDDDRIDAFIAALRVNAAPEPSATCSGGVTGTGSTPVDVP